MIIAVFSTAIIIPVLKISIYNKLTPHTTNFGDLTASCERKISIHRATRNIYTSTDIVKVIDKWVASKTTYSCSFFSV